MSCCKTCPRCGAALEVQEQCDCEKYPDIPAHELNAFKRAIHDPETRAQIVEILQGAGLLT